MVLIYWSSRTVFSLAVQLLQALQGLLQAWVESLFLGTIE